MQTMHCTVYNLETLGFIYELKCDHCSAFAIIVLYVISCYTRLCYEDN